MGRGGRVAEGNCLLNSRALIAHRGFESHPLRHNYEILIYTLRNKI
jgi:hypothetical protein